MNLIHFFALLGGLLVLAFAANRLFDRTRVPDVLVLLATGLLLGPVFGLVDASQLDRITHAFGTLALILILFEGGLELNLRDTLHHFPGGLLFGVLTYFFSVGLLATVAVAALGLSFRSALLIGAVLGCTSSSVVLPVLQQLKTPESVKVTLILEASLADVLAVLTVDALLELAQHGGGLVGSFVLGFAFEVSVSLVLAFLVGVLWSLILPVLSEQRFWHVLTFAAVLLLYAGVEAMGASGLIAVLAFGLTLSNSRRVDRRLVEATFGLQVPGKEPHEQILTFHSELAFLVRTFFFVLLGLTVRLGGLADQFLPALGLLGALVIARWLALHASRWAWKESDPRQQETILWILPRGLITAVLAVQVLEAEGPEFRFLLALAFAIIVATNLAVVVASVRARGPVPQETEDASPAPAPSEPGPSPDSSAS